MTDGLGSDRAALRLYTWDAPTLSFGRNEPADGLYDRAAAEEMGVRFVRRPTGGRAVLHDEELTYAVAVPVKVLGTPRETFAAISRALARGLVTLGLSVDIREDAPAVGLAAGACFDIPSIGEITVGGRKLVGSAQARIGSALLQHGSILLDGDQSRIGDLRTDGPHPSPSPGTIKSLLGDGIALSWVKESLAAGFREEFGGEWIEGAADRWDGPGLGTLRERYGSEGWTWRR